MAPRTGRAKDHLFLPRVAHCYQSPRRRPGDGRVSSSGGDRRWCSFSQRRIRRIRACSLGAARATQHARCPSPWRRAATQPRRIHLPSVLGSIPKWRASSDAHHSPGPSTAAAPRLRGRMPASPKQKARTCNASRAGRRKLILGRPPSEIPDRSHNYKKAFGRFRLDESLHSVEQNALSAVGVGRCAAGLGGAQFSTPDRCDERTRLRSPIQPAGQPPRLARWCTPHCFATACSRCRVTAKNRPSSRAPQRFSSTDTLRRTLRVLLRRSAPRAWGRP
jgi:hypothetical protein